MLTNLIFPEPAIGCTGDLPEARVARPWANSTPNVDELVDRINDWLMEQLTATVDEVKREFDLTAHQWNLIRARIDNTLLARTSTPGQRVQRYSDEDCWAAIREAFELNGRRPLTAVIYESMRDRTLHPSVPAIHNRFGSWRRACSAAGVPCGGRRNGSLEGTPARRWSVWTEDQLLEWVARYRSALKPTERTTYAGYDSWQRTQSAAPSGSLVRQRLRHIGNWGDIVAAALQYGIADDLAFDFDDDLDLIDSHLTASANGHVPERWSGRSVA